MLLKNTLPDKNYKIKIKSWGENPVETYALLSLLNKINRRIVYEVRRYHWISLFSREDIT